MIMLLILLLLSPLPVLPFLSQVVDKNAHYSVFTFPITSHKEFHQEDCLKRGCQEFSLLLILITSNTVLDSTAPLEKFIRQGTEFG
jgi:hypothetical protein